MAPGVRRASMQWKLSDSVHSAATFSLTYLCT